MQYVAAEHHLQIEIDAKECRIPEDVRARMQPGLDRLGQAVHDFPASQLWLTIVFHPRTSVYHAQAKLKVPGETIITGHRDAYLDIAMQGCMEKVIHRVEAYKADPDHDAVKHAERQAKLANAVIAPVEPDAGKLGQAFQSGDYEAFRRALLGQEEVLRKRVGRWVQRYPGVQAEVGNTFEIADLVEEVFLIAFEKYADRPTHIGLHEWFDSLIDTAVKSFWQNPDDQAAASFAQTIGRPPGA